LEVLIQPANDLAHGSDYGKGQTMLKLLSTAWQFVRQNDLPTIWRALISREAHPLLQFIKYGCCGVVAAITHNGILTILSLTLFPAVQGMLVDGQVLNEALRANNLVINNAIAWPFGTLVAYWLNILFVFTPGRHSKLTELAMFWIASAIGFFPGGFVAHWLASSYHLPSLIAQLGFVVTSVMVNFLCRKFVIFKN
jgi:putative flippase GtrA